MRAHHHHERHRIGQAGWLRAAVLGANDGLISTSSLVLGMAAAGTGVEAVLLAGVAGLAAGALSMAAGEYVSVSTQVDVERADLARERRELQAAPEAERRELADIYVGRGLSPELAARVAAELTAHDALAAHARDELGILELTRARPVQAALASAAAFAAGAVAPLAGVLLLPHALLLPGIGTLTVLLLLVLGALAARQGGAPLARGALRVAGWGLAAMVATAALGRLLGVALA